MKLNKKLIFILLPLFIASCSKTDELYKNNAYDTGSFETNYYLEHNNVDKLKIGNLIEKDASKVTFISSPKRGERIDGIIDNDQYFKYVDENGNEQSRLLEWNDDVPHNDYGYGFGPTKNLISIDKEFSYGFLSRLYDGRVRCDGYFAQSRVQIDKTGFSSFFPKQLKSAKYFALSLRGQTSCEGFDFVNADINLNLKLYKHNVLKEENDLISININHLKVPSNTHGEASLMLFYFIDVLGLDYSSYLDGVIAYSISFSLNNIDGKSSDFLSYGNPTDDKNDQNNPHFALMLYEFMLPDSTWN